jgi:hypothetical protein
VDIKSAGYFKLKVKAKASALPTFSITLSVDGEKVGGSGGFALDGTGSLKKAIRRKKSLQADLLVSLALDAVNQKVTGTVTPTNGPWTADLLGDQALWTSLNMASDYDGLYTLALPGDVVSTGGLPGGDGYGTVTLTDSNGIIKLAGSLGDGEKLSQKTGLSKDGQWPLYSRMNKDSTTGIFKGMVMGWVTVSPEPTRDLSGTLAWIKQGPIGTLYPAGFTNSVALTASPYTIPAATELAITLLPDSTNGVGQLTIAAEAGQTPAVTVTNIVLNPMPLNKFTVPADVTNNPVTLKLSKPLFKTGVVKGTFFIGVNKTPFVGVILKDQNVARGFFKGAAVPAESGSFLLEAQQ